MGEKEWQRGEQITPAREGVETDDGRRKSPLDFRRRQAYNVVTT